MNRLVMFAGAGGNGKTSLASWVEQNLGFTRMPSPTRQFYADMGVKDEKELYSQYDDKFRESFQHALGIDFNHRLLNFVEANKGKDIVVERSPFCHFAYYMFNVPGISLKQISDRQNLIHELLETLDSNHGYEPYVILLPYPTTWIQAQSNADTFRLVQGGKDTIIQTLVRHFLVQAQMTIGLNGDEFDEEALEVWGDNVRYVLGLNDSDTEASDTLDDEFLSDVDDDFGDEVSQTSTVTVLEDLREFKD
jgi:predicted ATPase